MAIAGKVAITLATENGGAWSADVTYDRLVAVKHNNNLYISRKTVANVEPPNDEFWFLALEGYSGADVQELINRMNEFANTLEAIINGTQQVGNAKTIDGHGAEEFSKKTDLAKYLPLNNGTTIPRVTIDSATAMALKNIGTYLNSIVIQYEDANGVIGLAGFKNREFMLQKFTNGVESDWFTILHTGNKPTGTYVGNGDATERTIDIGGLLFSSAILIRTGDYGGFALITQHGGIAKVSDSSVLSGITWGEAGFSGGKLTLRTTNSLLNASGVAYYYEVL